MKPTTRSTAMLAAGLLLVGPPLAAAGLEEARIAIEKYEVIVADVDAFVPGSAPCFVIPPDQLQPGHEYGYEVLAVATNHNQTITAGSFETE